MSGAVGGYALQVDAVIGLGFGDALQAFQAGCAAARFARALTCAVSANERLFALNVLLLALILDLLAAQRLIFQRAVFGVVAGECLQASVVHFQDALGYLV